MANNRVPIAVKSGSIQSIAGAVIGPSANTAFDGTGSNISVIALAQEASVDKDMHCYFLRFKAANSPAATVARVFIYSGSSGTFTAGTSNTAANTWLVDELSLAAQTASQTASSPAFTLPINMIIPAGYRILVTFGTSTGASGTGYVVTSHGAFY